MATVTPANEQRMCVHPSCFMQSVRIRYGTPERCIVCDQETVNASEGVGWLFDTLGRDGKFSDLFGGR